MKEPPSTAQFEVWSRAKTQRKSWSRREEGDSGKPKPNCQQTSAPQRELLAHGVTREVTEESPNMVDNWSRDSPSRVTKQAEEISGKNIPTVFKETCKLHKVNELLKTENDKGTRKYKKGNGEITLGDIVEEANHVGSTKLVGHKILVDSETEAIIPKEKGSSAQAQAQAFLAKFSLGKLRALNSRRGKVSADSRARWKRRA